MQIINDTALNKQRQKKLSDKKSHKKPLSMASPGKVSAVKVIKGTNNANWNLGRGGKLTNQIPMGVVEGMDIFSNHTIRNKNLIPGGLIT